MSLDPEYIEQLVFKFQNGSITPAELKTLQDWYRSHDDAQVHIPSGVSEETVKVRMLNGLLTKVRTPSGAPQPKNKQTALIWLAAAVVLLVGLGVWVTWNQQSDPIPEESSAAQVEPGGHKATLTLANGKQIVLNTTQTGIVIGQDITYNDGTALALGGIYDANESSNGPLTLHTPRGGMYQITLSDSTQVWLNSASSLTYPESFEGQERVVELSGEAYFDVQDLQNADGNKIPFRVRSKEQEIEVLGTEFNISAYPEQATKTTLIEGKVRVKGEQSQVTLQPGEQATTTQGQTQVKAVAAGSYTAWRYGKFSFNDKSFQEIMTEVGRWYDLSIEYENEIPSDELVGDAFRNQNLGLVLRLLDAIAVDYTLDVDQRKLIIKGKKQTTDHLKTNPPMK